MPRVRQLLTRPSPALRDGLVAYEAALRSAFPLQAKHRKQTPGAIRELSEMLTTDRSSLPPDYMNRARFLGAYLHWFLPWNLLRQGRLLQGLDLELKDGARVVDLGSGPLTFFLALWLAQGLPVVAASNQLAGDIFQKAGGFGRLAVPVVGAVEGVGEEQAILGPGDTDVEQAAFLGHTFRVIEGAGMRQGAVL